MSAALAASKAHCLAAHVAAIVWNARQARTTNPARFQELAQGGRALKGRLEELCAIAGLDARALVAAELA